MQPQNIQRKWVSPQHALGHITANTQRHERRPHPTPPRPIRARSHTHRTAKALDGKYPAGALLFADSVSVSLSLCQSRSLCLYVSLSLCLSVSLSLSLSLCLYLSLSVCRFPSLYHSLSIFLFPFLTCSST